MDLISILQVNKTYSSKTQNNEMIVKDLYAYSSLHRAESICATSIKKTKMELELFFLSLFLLSFTAVGMKNRRETQTEGEEVEIEKKE